jgi:hypothetical protein
MLLIVVIAIWEYLYLPVNATIVLLTPPIQHRRGQQLKVSRITVPHDTWDSCVRVSKIPGENNGTVKQIRR